MPQWHNSCSKVQQYHQYKLYYTTQGNLYNANNSCIKHNKQTNKCNFSMQKLSYDGAYADLLVEFFFVPNETISKSKVLISK